MRSYFSLDTKKPLTNKNKVPVVHTTNKNRHKECLKKNMNASRPSEHPPVRRGQNVKTFSRWYYRLQRQNLFMAFERVPVSMYVVCMYVWSSHIAEYGSTG